LKLISECDQNQRFTVSQLARQSGVSIATIKFYLREGLLGTGDLRAEKKAYYDEVHLRRLVLIRALRELVRLPVERVRRLTRVLDRGNRSTFELVASAVEALSSPRKLRPTRAARALREQVYEKLRARGLEVRPESATLDALAQSLLVLSTFETAVGVDVLDGYLDYLLPLAEAEFAANRERIVASAESAMTGAIVGTVLFEPMILALRRIAHEHFAKRVFDAP